MNEVDRPGSFCTHIYRAVYLLLDVLLETKDNQLLLHVSAFLYKTPDKDRYVVTSYHCIISSAEGKIQVHCFTVRFQSDKSNGRTSVFPLLLR